MKHLIEGLRQRHRALNRQIDTCRASDRQDELKKLKRMRLRIKDRLAALAKQAQPSR